MKKIIKLTESDLKILVKRVLKEKTGEELDKMLDDYWASHGGYPEPKPKPEAKKGPFVSHPSDDEWYDAIDRNVSEPSGYSEEKEFGPDEYDDFMEFINGCNTMWCIKTKEMYDKYANKGNIKVRK